MTADELRRIAPYSAGKAEVFAQPLEAAMQEFAITTARRRSAFIAQVAHETAEFHYMRELADGAAYEGCIDLGNTQPGDGRRFPGRGGLMATGRGMYTKLRTALGIDCVSNPSLLESPSYACRSAAWIWAVDKRLNPLADGDKFGHITLAINGGYTHLDERIAYWLVARKVEGI